MASLWCVRDKESTQIYQVLYASLKPGMDKAEATPGRDHSPSQHPQRPESQLLDSVYFDLQCVSFLEGEERAIGYFHPAEPSNKPLEWTGHPQLSAMGPSAPCLQFRGSVIQNPYGYL